MSDNEADVMSVLDLVAHERQARDRGWWSRLERCYTPEATIRTSWFDGTAVEYIEVSKRVFDHTPSTHRLGLPVIDVNGTRAIAEVPVTIEMRGAFRGVETDLVAYLRMLHRVERGAGGWWLAAGRVGRDLRPRHDDLRRPRHCPDAGSGRPSGHAAVLSHVELVDD
ncbi:nuclear transport factor 2 family protein [Amycolatopsis sp. NBC_00355]|uniref:nuclear transport factor 2 family protein n=1 Tax=Amycolatopsis sp. NBC_00355 TaxID=2975957 RepID=UPI002E25CA2A